MNTEDLSKSMPSTFFKMSYIYIGIIFLCGWRFAAQGAVIGKGIIALSIFLLGLQYLYSKRKKNEAAEYIRTLAFHLDEVRQNVFASIPVPYVILEKEGAIQWYNLFFEEMLSLKNSIGKNIIEVVPELSYIFTQKDGEDFELPIKVKERYYTAYVKQMQHKQESFYAVYFIENTETVKLQASLEGEKPIVGLIYIDNYDEVMEGLQDIKRPLIVAVIEKKINGMAEQVQGIIKRIERDKYILFFPKKHLKTLENNKFEILDLVRDIDIGNTIPVTLSMGIGSSCESYIENFTYAKAAVDLALGRGGDQAIIKNKDKIVFFGGKTKEVEKSTRVKARVKSYALRELIEDSDRVIVMGHKNVDLDCLGAAIGISRAAKAFEKPVNIILTHIPLAIESIYYKMKESGKYDDLFIDVSTAKQRITDKTLLVVVDVHRPNYTEAEELLKICKNIVVIDHHRRSVEYIENAVLNYVEPYASSTCELVTEVLQYIQEKIKLEPIEADALLAGITVDTKNFVFKTGVRTFEAASYLRRSGADSTRVRMLFKNDMETYQAKSSTVSTAEIYREHVAISLCPTNSPNPIIVAAQAADELLNIQGVHASFVMVSTQEKIMISGRSLGDINVQVILEKLGGGGHMTVAGAQLTNVDVDTAKGLLKNAIDEYIEEGER